MLYHCTSPWPHETGTLLTNLQLNFIVTLMPFASREIEMAISGNFLKFKQMVQKFPQEGISWKYQTVQGIYWNPSIHVKITICIPKARTINEPSWQLGAHRQLISVSNLAAHVRKVFLFLLNPRYVEQRVYASTCSRFCKEIRGNYFTFRKKRHKIYFLWKHFHLIRSLSKARKWGPSLTDVNWNELKSCIDQNRFY